MPESTIIDSVYQDMSEILDYLQSNQETSYYANLNNQFKKSLIVSIASFYENEITKILLKYVDANSNNNVKLSSFLKIKAIDRQYHTYFNWKDSKNANQFLGLFGTDFLNVCKAEIKTKDDLQESIKLFIELGKDRNDIAHNFFETNTMNLTTQDIYEKYKKSYKFIEFLKEKFQ